MECHGRSSSYTAAPDLRAQVRVAQRHLDRRHLHSFSFRAEDQLAFEMRCVLSAARASPLAGASGYGRSSGFPGDRVSRSAAPQPAGDQENSRIAHDPFPSEIEALGAEEVWWSSLNRQIQNCQGEGRGSNPVFRSNFQGSGFPLARDLPQSSGSTPSMADDAIFTRQLRRIPNQSPRPPCARVPCPSADLGERTYQRRSLDSASSSRQVSYRSRPWQGVRHPAAQDGGDCKTFAALCLREGQRLQSNSCAGICVRRVSLHLDPTTSVWVAAAPWGNDLGSDSACTRTLGTYNEGAAQMALAGFSKSLIAVGGVPLGSADRPRGRCGDPGFAVKEEILGKDAAAKPTTTQTKSLAPKAPRPLRSRSRVEPGI